ncbi:MAG: tRNA pseudouridine(38-40) synthase TruA [Candidatus Eisenbacteria bacterium]|nr:tRNA pseudouridine(38-40) synthase TruA [Candidatus Eisenbacteria bacterium]
MRNIRLTVEYDGTAFHGWQRQSRVRTVQGDLEAALSVILREPIAVRGAGRTDAGVHALGQVANFRTESDLSLERIERGVNALTKADLAVRDAREADEQFDARMWACGRHYLYLLLAQPSSLWNERAYRPRRWPDLGRMNATAAHFAGDHDFSEFSCASDDEPGVRARVFYARWEPWDRGAMFRIGAVRFLYKMVRCVVAACLQAGQGAIDSTDIEARLAAPAHRGRAVAPARGLHLLAVDYPAGKPDFEALRRGREGAAGGFDCLPPKAVL